MLTGPTGNHLGPSNQTDSPPPYRPTRPEILVRLRGVRRQPLVRTRRFSSLRPFDCDAGLLFPQPSTMRSLSGTAPHRSRTSLHIDVHAEGEHRVERERGVERELALDDGAGGPSSTATALPVVPGGEPITRSATRSPVRSAAATWADWPGTYRGSPGSLGRTRKEAAPHRRGERVEELRKRVVRPHSGADPPAPHVETSTSATPPPSRRRPPSRSALGSRGCGGTRRRGRGSAQSRRSARRTPRRTRRTRPRRGRRRCPRTRPRSRHPPPAGRRSPPWGTSRTRG